MKDIFSQCTYECMRWSCLGILWGSSWLLAIDQEQVCGPFKVCRTRAATCEVTMSIADILIPQLHTLQETNKLGRA